MVEISPNSKGVYSKLLKFGLTVIAGGKRFAHSVFLGDSDKIFKELFGVEKMVSSSTAITRLLQKLINILNQITNAMQLELEIVKNWICNLKIVSSYSFINY